MTRRPVHRAPARPTRYGWALRRGIESLAVGRCEWDTAAEARDALRDAFFALDDRAGVEAVVTSSDPRWSPSGQRATFFATASTES